MFDGVALVCVRDMDRPVVLAHGRVAELLAAILVLQYARVQEGLAAVLAEGHDERVAAPGARIISAGGSEVGWNVL